MFKHNIAFIGSLMGDAARCAILIALLEGRALTAGELAARANISAQTASSHLNKLIAGKLITRTIGGRHRYYRLSHPAVAHLLEAFALVAPRSPQARFKTIVTDLQRARTCYDHIAGKLGVGLTQSFLTQNILVPDKQAYALSQKGRKIFTTLGIDLKNIEKKRRRFAYPCLDWSERVFHLAGALGSALLLSFLEKRWILRASEGRAIYLTQEGKWRFNALFQLSL